MMFKVIKDQLKMMALCSRQLTVSLILSFIDGFLLTVPLLIAFRIIASLPELYPETAHPLNVTTMMHYTAVLLALLPVRILLRYTVLRLRSGAGYEVMCEERKKLGKKLRTTPMGFFNEKNLGDLTAAITSDAAFIEIEGLGVIEKAALGIPAFTVGFAVLFYFDYRIALAVLALFIPVYGAYRLFTAVHSRENRQELIGSVTEDALEFIKGLHVLKTCNMADKRFAKTQKAFETLRKFSIRAEFRFIPSGALLQLTFRLITAAIIMLTGIYTVRGECTFPVSFFLMTCSFTLFTAVELMSIFSVFAKMSEQSMERLNLIKKLPEMQEISGRERLEHFDIVFDNVQFAYTGTPVLQEVSFTVKENSITALTGLSGSGKTTIAHLIARFWEADSGRILIGGKSLKDIDYEYLLQNISFVFQDVFLFNDTVLNNIRIGRKEASFEEVQKAAEKARCSDFIMQLENGYDTIIGEAGVKLSGGEKQRLSIARAIIKNAPIVLLDEVSANVDPENEREIIQALTELLHGKTVLIIAHKLASVKHADQILVLENGRIGERGTHTELYARNGLYKKLFDMQFQTAQWRV